MPRIFDIPKVGPVEFPDDFTDEQILAGGQEMMRVAERKESIRAEGATPLKPALMERTAEFMEPVLRPVLAPFDLNRMGRVAGGLAADVLTPQVPGVFPATAAALAGQPMPAPQAAALAESPIRAGIVDAASLAPTVGAGMAAPFGAAGLPIAMFAERFSETGGDLAEAGKTAAIGAAIPVVGGAGRALAGRAIAGAVNRGSTALARPAVQRAIEAGAGAGAIEGMMTGQLIMSPEFQQATPEEQRDMLIRNATMSLIFTGPDVAAAVNPAVRPMAQRWESPAVRVARQIEQASVQPRAEPIPTTEVPVVTAAPDGMQAVVGAPSRTTQPLRRQLTVLPGGAVIEGVGPARLSGPRPVNVVAREPVVGVERIGQPREDPGGGQVSFAAEAPTLLRNQPETRENQVQETGRLPVEQREPPVAQPEVQTQAGTAQRAGEGQEIATSDRIIRWLESKRVDTSGKLYDATIGLPIAVYNAAIDVAIGAVKAGRAIGDAVTAAVEYAKKQGRPFDEAKLRSALESGVQEILPPKTVRPGTATAPPVPEPANVVAEQLRLTVDPKSTKAATLLTPDSDLPDIPAGLRHVETKHGTVLYNPKKTNRVKVLAAASGDVFDATLLGMSTEQPAAGTQVVATSTPRAQNVVAQVTSGTPQAVAAATKAQQAAVPGGKTQVKPAAQVVAQRTGATPPTTTPPPTATRPLKTLDDAYKVFEAPEKPRTSPFGLATRVSDAIRTGLFSKYRPIASTEKAIRKAYGISGIPRQDAAAFFETLRGSSGKAELDIYNFNRDVVPNLKGISEKDFNAFMLAGRTIDRLTADPTRKVVADWTIDDARNVQRQLEAKLGPQKIAQIAQASGAYQRHTDQALQLQVATGRMSQKTYDDIRDSNDFYAPFRVMQKLLEFDALPPGTGRQVDTQAELTKAIKGIRDTDFRLLPMLDAARQQIAISRILAEKNLRMQRIRELAAMDTAGIYVKKLGKNQDPAKGRDSVVVMEDGEPVHYEVSKAVHDAIKDHNAAVGSVISKFLMLGAKPFRAGATWGNLVFQAVNLAAADQPRLALVSKLGLRDPLDLYRYPMDFIGAMYSSMKGNLGIGEMPKLYRDFLESGAAGSTIQKYLTPDSLNFQTPEAIAKSKRLTASVIDTPAKFANAIEETTKLMGLKRAMRITGATSGADLARRAPDMITEIRRFAGSPDFGRVGKLTDNARLNLLFMFFNARLQGTSADIGRLAGGEGIGMAAATSIRLGGTVGVLTMLNWLKNNSDEFRSDYNQLSETERRNYWLIPKPKYIVNEQGQRVRDWWRIPKRETAKLMANIVEEGLHFAEQRDPKALKEFAVSALEDIAPVNVTGRSATERIESVVSSMNPIVRAPIELATGRNTYLHRDIILDERQKKSDPELQYSRRTQEVFKRLAVAMPDWAPEFLRSPARLENLTQNLTAGLVTQFLPTKGIEGREGFENWRFLRRFQTTGYIDDPKTRERIQELNRQQANESLIRQRKAEEAADAANGDPRVWAQEVAKRFERSDKKGIDRAKEIWQARQAGVTWQDRQLLNLSPPQRAQLISEHLSEMDRTDAAKYLKTMKDRRVLSEETAAEILKIRRGVTGK